MSRKLVIESADTATKAQWERFDEFLQSRGWRRDSEDLAWVHETLDALGPPTEVFIRLAMEAAGMDREPEWHRGVAKLTPAMRRALKDEP